MAECTVRLMRTQKVENAMFDLTSSVAGSLDESIKSLSDGNEIMIQETHNAFFIGWQFDPHTFTNKMFALSEIAPQHLANITGWAYVEDNMPITAKYIIKRCANENLNLHDFITREMDQAKHEIIKIDLAEEVK